jgi:ABC-type uncharacterized transport system permease subunit
MPAHFWMYQSAFLLQLVALALFVGYAVSPRRSFSSAATAALGLSLALLAFFTVLLGARVGRLPLASGFEFVLVWSLALTSLVVWVEWRHQLGLLGLFLTPLGALTLLMGFPFARTVAQPVEGLPTALLFLHVALVVAAFACFSATAGVAGAFLVQARQLKRKHLGSVSYHLPALGVLDALAARLTLGGLLLLAWSLVAGFAFKWRWYGALGLDDVKVRFAMGVLAAWTGLLLLRRQGALQGRRLAWMQILFFVALFLAYYVVNRFWGGHGFLQALQGGA